MTEFNPNIVDADFGVVLREKFTEVGYLDVMQSISDATYPQQIIEHLLPTVDPELSAILQLFCLGRHVPMNLIPTSWNDVLSTFQECGIVRIAGSHYTMAPLCIYVVEGILYIAECPNPLFSVYFGEDSHALLGRKRILAPNHTRVLDLCSGAGIQGISYINQASEIHLVELNPLAGNLAELNAAINFPNNCIDVHVTDLVTYLETQTLGFDLVLCNPPLVPLPDCYNFNQVSHGGWDGLRFVRPILGKIDQLLAPGGQLLTIGVSACTGGIPEIEKCLSTYLTGMEVSACLTYLRRLPISKGGSWLAMIHDSLLNFGMTGQAPDLDSLAEAYRATETDSVVFYTVSIVRPLSGSQNCLPVRIVDFTKIANLEGAWKLR